MAVLHLRSTALGILRRRHVADLHPRLALRAFSPGWFGASCVVRLCLHGVRYINFPHLSSQEPLRPHRVVWQRIRPGRKDSASFQLAISRRPQARSLSYSLGGDAPDGARSWSKFLTCSSHSLQVGNLHHPQNLAAAVGRDDFGGVVCLLSSPHHTVAKFRVPDFAAMVPARCSITCGSIRGARRRDRNAVAVAGELHRIPRAVTRAPAKVRRQGEGLPPGRGGLVRERGVSPERGRGQAVHMCRLALKCCRQIGLCHPLSVRIRGRDWRRARFCTYARTDPAIMLLTQCFGSFHASVSRSGAFVCRAAFFRPSPDLICAEPNRGRMSSPLVISYCCYSVFSGPCEILSHRKRQAQGQWRRKMICVPRVCIRDAASHSSNAGKNS